MVDRIGFNHCVRVVSALALLVAMTTSPLRPFKANSGSDRPDAVRSNLAGAPKHLSFPTRLLPTSVVSRPVSVKALPTSNEEEELDGASHPDSDLFDPPHSVCAMPSAKPVPVSNVRSPHLLRC
jgi:hypothetical protein